MTFTVEMVRGKPEQNNFQIFDMDVWTWRILLEFGKANGWKASGTLADERYSKFLPDTYMKFFKSDYEPESWGLHKVFDAADAFALAEALTNGITKVLAGKIPPPVRDGPCLLNSDTGYVSPDVSKIPYLRHAKDFSEFLRGGSFIFAFDD